MNCWSKQWTLNSWFIFSLAILFLTLFYHLCAHTARIIFDLICKQIICIDNKTCVIKFNLVIARFIFLHFFFSFHRFFAQFPQTQPHYHYKFLSVCLFNQSITILFYHISFCLLKWGISRKKIKILFKWIYLNNLLLSIINIFHYKNVYLKSPGNFIIACERQII